MRAHRGHPRSTRPGHAHQSARALVAMVATVAMLGVGAAACGGGGTQASRPTTGEGLYRAYCQTCHGVDGQGGVGPRLAGVVAQRYPDIEAQVAVVTNGTGRMPAFRGRLSAAEIRKVVEHTRTELGR